MKNTNGSLAEMYPEIAVEWDPEKNVHGPEHYSAHSNAQAFWLCGRGHSWKAEINNRTSNKSGCPFCAGKRPIPGETDLLTLRPDIAAEWDYKNNKKSPAEYTVSSHAKVSWMCQRGHHWEAEISNRTNHNTVCPYCAGKRLILGETDLLTLRPDIAAEWDDENNKKPPAEYIVCSDAKVSWRCERGHRWIARIATRTRSGTGCPFCAGRLPIPGETDLLTLRPDITAEWDYEENDRLPSEYSVYSHANVSWRCQRGHHWKAQIETRTANGNGCPYCAGHRVIPGETDLVTLRPDIAAEWDDENKKSPTEYTIRSNAKVSWRCERGHRWEAVIASRTRAKRGGCPFCAGRLPVPGETDLLTLRPDIAAEWDDENNEKSPAEYTVSSNVAVSWKCKRGHRWVATINNRTNSGSGCPFCFGHKKANDNRLEQNDSI